MRIEILGSGGAITTPRPGCDCPVCVEARTKGIPYSRSGPSVFVHGPDILIDTPEEIKDQLNRSRVSNINACFYSHWHPDHVMGRRVFETRNVDWRHWPPHPQPTDVYLPEQVGRDFRRFLASWDHLAFLQKQGSVRIIEMADGDEIQFDDARVTPFRLAEDYVYAFLIETPSRRVLLVPDETLGWIPPERLRGVDLAVLPMGVVEFDPFTGVRRIPAEHPILRHEVTFAQTLGIVDALEAGRTILSHIEEPDGLSYDNLLRLQQELADEGRMVEFAFDGMLIDVD